VLCTVYETTSQVRAERERHAEYERLLQLFQQAPGFMAVLRGPNHVFEYANEAYLKLIGRKDILGRTVREAVPNWLVRVSSTSSTKFMPRASPSPRRAWRPLLQREPGASSERASSTSSTSPSRTATGR
jgi:PAS domain-containing protein